MFKPIQNYFTSINVIMSFTLISICDMFMYLFILWLNKFKYAIAKYYQNANFTLNSINHNI